ncbi:MAG: hypothetical protein ACRDOK_28230 [Streptosporangiaceae bacterium]
MTNLASILDRPASAQPDRAAIRLDDLTVSYQRLSDAALPKGPTGTILRREVRPPEDSS